MTDLWIIDKSAYVRLHASPDADEWLDRINRGLVRVTTVTLLEMGFSARSGRDWRRGIEEPPAANLPIENLTPRMETRAVEVQRLLAAQGHHRDVKIPDLLIAAAGELAGLTVLHVDKDFDLIADLTGQPVERLRGDF
ncbi:PIN domain nuclease [Phytoactinopolyspora halotolerans]|uniref:Ribonuclease VapC n=1 Tax=Phytoactinopolyspora halotolerans TaxID=1981512 RepID=A0A6L9SBK1_9ACTN|nr:PIN domain nuclease [Phytoactinopolyspora halotolerans]